jgi:hypothetical protein
LCGELRLFFRHDSAPQFTTKICSCVCYLALRIFYVDTEVSDRFLLYVCT